MDSWRTGVLVLKHHTNPSIDWYASVHTTEKRGKTRQSRYLTVQNNDAEKWKQSNYNNLIIS